MKQIFVLIGIWVSAAYTFGFGKKIKVGNEVSQMSGAGNAILK